MVPASSSYIALVVRWTARSSIVSYLIVASLVVEIAGTTAAHARDSLVRAVQRIKTNSSVSSVVRWLGGKWVGVGGSGWEWVGVGGSGWEWVGVGGSGWEWVCVCRETSNKC
jgi:hypothetical protein